MTTACHVCRSRKSVLLLCLLLTLAPGVAAAVATIGHLGPIAPDTIGVTIQAGTVIHGTQVPYAVRPGDRLRRGAGGAREVLRDGRLLGWRASDTLVTRADRYVGPDIDSARLDTPHSYRLSSIDDDRFAAAQSPRAVSRKSRPCDLPRTGGPLRMPVAHTVYLSWPVSLQPGARYRLQIDALSGLQQDFVYDPAAMRSEAVHVSHLGFRPDDPLKAGFVSLWTGSGGGWPYTGKISFAVVDNATGAAVFTGCSGAPRHVPGQAEDAYERDYTRSRVYLLDFSAFATPGVYRLVVAGVGSSYPFRIAADAWLDALRVSTRGLYHQRSGIAVGPPWSEYRRPRCFHPADGVIVHGSRARLMDTGNGFRGGDNFAGLVSGATDALVRDAWGGYCDAGDWDRRIQHLSIARALLDLLLLCPDTFAGLELPIPESDNALPDLLDEALWGVDFFRRLQTASGGVRGGIESAAHPVTGETSWQESQPVLAYAPGIWSSYLYAATAARAAVVLQRIAAARAAVYANSAHAAMQWAESRWPAQPGGWPAEIRDARNLAAAELFRLDGSARWHRVFLQTTVFGRDGAVLRRYQSHDQAEAAWVYVRTAAANPAVAAACRRAICRAADALIAAQRRAAFGWAKDPWLPAAQGVFSRPDCAPLVWAHALSAEQRYVRALVLACQAGAGANPVNLCYTTGLGHAQPRHVLHIDSRLTGQPPPAGITVCGPLDLRHFGGRDNPYARQVAPFCFPAPDSWPAGELFFDICWWPEMCEFNMHHLLAPTMYAWGYLAGRPHASRSGIDESE